MGQKRFPVLRIVWWVSVAWLSLAAVGTFYWFIQWLIDKSNPARYEYAIGAAIVLFYSWPAGVGVLLTGIVPRTGISRRRRIGGVALLLFCIVALKLFDYLQTRYR